MEGIDQGTTDIVKALKVISKIDTDCGDYGLACFHTYVESVNDSISEFWLDGFIDYEEKEDIEEEIKRCRDFANHLETFLNNQLEKADAEDAADINAKHKCGIKDCNESGVEIIVCGSYRGRFKYVVCHKHSNRQNFDFDPIKKVRVLKTYQFETQ